jgi:hypothetical protein
MVFALIEIISCCGMHKERMALLRRKSNKGGTTLQTSLCTAVERLDCNKHVAV